jgi:predicted enzyme related to lactoylglutathione lyase
MCIQPDYSHFEVKSNMTAKGAKYVHTNIVARDWRALAEFYQNVFACTPVPPERHYQGPWVAAVTGLADVSLEGIHLRVPGYGEQGPTLEIFQYSRQPDRPTPATNQPGFAHIAFHVDDVSQARQEVLSAGGADLGKMHSMEVPNAGTVTLVYMTDPEGNIIELQNWSS